MHWDVMLCHSSMLRPCRDKNLLWRWWLQEFTWNICEYLHSTAYLTPCNKGKKVVCSHYRPGVAQRVGRGIALHFHDRGTRTGWVVSSTLRPHFTRPGKTRYRRLGGTQGQSGWVENLVPTGIQSRTIQPVRCQSLYQLSYPDHNTM
jgi:hypothetical protein